MSNKTLKECDERLSDIKEMLKAILQEQEEAIKEWNAAFVSESPENIECVYESVGQRFVFVLLKGDTRLEVAELWMDGEILQKNTIGRQRNIILIQQKMEKNVNIP